MSNVTPLKQRQAADRSRVWLSPAQVCEHVPGMTERNLEELRGKGKGPRYFKPTLKTVLYDRADVDAWIEATQVTTRDAS